MDEITRIKGGAFGYAFTARMCGDNPDLDEETRKVYRWAEQAFIKLARGDIFEEQAILGIGG